MRTILFFIIIFHTCNTWCQVTKKDTQRWDQRMIDQSKAWHYIYKCSFKKNNPENLVRNKKDLDHVKEKFPSGKWHMEALILESGLLAADSNTYNIAITNLRETAGKYSGSGTLVTGWDPYNGCTVNSAWVYYMPLLSARDREGNVVKAYPFDRDSLISYRENLALTYFDHLETHPNKVEDVARYIIANILINHGKTGEAIKELEGILSGYKDLSVIKNRDLTAFNGPYGHYIGFEPPNQLYPVTRVLYQVWMSLIDLYMAGNETAKAIELANRFASECSPEGWLWYYNQKIGKYLVQLDQNDLAIQHFKAARNGIDNAIIRKAKHLELLYREGYLSKPEDFTSWKNVAGKNLEHEILEIEHNLSELSTGK